ncbi:MAG: RdgB/HAM1 family non-canonical purine NTP pyrophosphatase [candidate division Zixibacteria bacterium]|nr:RdgB/HAM1 family non-canonical purine NTP pyrophosphatase [candidate division Zixibacteria bacterium]
MTKHTLIIATNNRDKLAEIKDILKRTDIEILSAADFDDFPDVEETGATLEENALLKAQAVWDKYHLPCAADDTGLEVDCLDGAPGVFSSRYAGENATYDDNCRKLLSEVSKALSANRAARFRTVMAFIDSEGVPHTADGTIEGEIIDTKRGDNGFGYDPLFLEPLRGKTLAELDATEKNKISHRHNALVNILPIIIEKFK